MIFPHLKLKIKASTTSKEKKRCVEKQIFSFLVVIAWSFEDMAKKDALPNGLEKMHDYDYIKSSFSYPKGETDSLAVGDREW